ncbi:MAG: DUF1836 domain-containing protein [Lachnospiraceae bacterium]|nr:DUF1836 domain-containing protein [Lachnospiraceae bacterium]
MTLDHNDLIKSIMESLSRIEHIKLDDIPNIDLYMDQVTTLMDTKLRATTRYPKEDKILTKTMINNYAKNDLLPPPVKKKYSKEHVLLLIFIYYFKGVLSINDIQTLLQPLAEKYFNNTQTISLPEIYEEVFSLEPAEVEALKQDVLSKYQHAQESFADAEGEDAEFLRQFSFICMLSYDVYIKKLMIEKIIDEMRAKKPAGKQEKKEQKDS